MSGFFVAVSPVLAAHTATVSVDKTVVKGGISDTYNFTVTKTSGDGIAYVKIANSDFSSFSGLSCPAGWSSTISSTYIECSWVFGKPLITESQIINFQALAPSTSGIREWAVYSQDLSASENILSQNVNVDADVPTTTDNAPSGWQTTSASVTLTRDDGSGSGVANTYYTTDGSTPTTGSSVYSEPIIISGQGTTILKYFSVDNVGNIEDIKTATIQIDSIAPVTSDDVSAGWHIGDVTVTLATFEESSDILSTSYILNGGATTTYSAPIVISGEGTNLLQYFSVDGAGNVESVKSVEVEIDKTKPSTTYGIEPVAPNGAHSWYTSAPTISLACESGLGDVSACDKVKYKWNGDSYTDYSDVITAPEGTNTLYYQAYDVAGNVEVEQQSQIIKLDTINPSLTGNVISNSIFSPGVADGNKDTTSIDLSFSESVDYVINIKNSVDSVVESWSGYDVIDLDPKVWSGSSISNGVYTVSVVITDDAGNSAPFSVGSITVDNTAPTLSVVSIASNNTTNNLAKIGDVITLSFTADEALGVIPVVIIAGHNALVSGSGPYTATYTMDSGDTEGSIVFTINFSDVAGNAGSSVGATTDATAITFDKTDPVAVVTEQVATYTSNSTPNVKINVELLATWQIKNGVDVLASGIGTGAEQDVAMSPLPDGMYSSIKLIAIDPAGNNTGTIFDSFTIDTILPTVEITTPAANVVYKNSDLSAVPFTANVVDATTVTCQYQVDGGALTPTDCNSGSLVGITDGKHLVTLVATDSAGNSAFDADTIVFDADNTLTVGSDKDFSTILEAVNGATTGDVINIDTGVYSEDVIISGKNLILMGVSGTVSATSFTLTSASVSGSSNVSAPIININSGSLIQEGIEMVSSGGTVNVGAGTFAETVVLENRNSLTIDGVGDITIIEPVSGIGFEVKNSDNITIKNLKIHTTGLSAHGIWVAGTPNGFENSNNLTIQNNTILVDGKSSGIYAEKVSPAHDGWTVSGNAISAPNLGVDLELYDVDNSTISENVFNISGSVAVVYASENSNVGSSTFSDNTFNGNGNVGGVTPGFWIESDFQSGDGDTNVDSVSITGNIFNEWTNAAIQIGEVDSSSPFSDIINIVISSNKFIKSSPIATIKNYASSVNAGNNWWGVITGPHDATNPSGIGDILVGNIDYQPWCTNSACSDDNSVPVISDLSVSTDEDVEKVISLGGTDPESDTLSYIILSGPTHGSLGSVNLLGEVTYTPVSNYHGADSFTFKVNDGISDSLEATVSITVNSVNDAPVAVNESYSTDEDTDKTIAKSELLSNDTDADLDSLSILSVGSAIHGIAIISGSDVIFTPEENYNGEASFEYVVSDGFATDSGLVTITVNPVNDVPVASAQSVSTDEDGTLNIILTGSDIDEDSLTYIKLTDPIHGLLTGGGANWAYAPEANYFGEDSFTFKVNDGISDSLEATVSITVNSINDLPTISLTSPNGGEKWSDSHNITWSASDIEAGPLTITLKQSINGGSTWTDIVTGEANDGSYSWDTNSVADGVDYKVKAMVSDGGDTSEDISDVVFTIDNTLPAVTSKTPSANSVGIDPNGNVIVVFSEAVNISSGEITLQKGSDPAVTVLVNFDSGTNTATIDPSVELTNNSTYSVTLSGVTDLAGNVMSDVSWSYTTAASYSVPLSSGWNLVSIPVVPNNTAIETVLGDAENDIESVWSYDTASDIWSVYHPSGDPETNSLVKMTAGYGYWINYVGSSIANLTGSGSILLPGNSTPPSRQLAAGWNLIGYYQRENTNTAVVSDALANSLTSHWSLLTTYDNTAKTFSFMDSSDSMAPGQAFWIFLTGTIGQLYNYTIGNL